MTTQDAPSGAALPPGAAEARILFDLGTRLWQLRYKGAYRVLTEVPLPNPGLVLREVRGQCPGLDVDLLSMDTLRI
jgi:hypothetical protein